MCRPTFIHEYRINEYSLYAAMSVGLETKDIVEVLGRLSKVSISLHFQHPQLIEYSEQTPLPQTLVRSIHKWTSAYGKVKLVLKRNRYYLESSVPEMIQRLLADETIRSCRLYVSQNPSQAQVETGQRPTASGLIIPGTTEARKVAGKEGQVEEERDRGDDLLGAVIGIDRADELDEDDRVQSFEVDGSRMEVSSSGLRISLRNYDVDRSCGWV